MENFIFCESSYDMFIYKKCFNPKTKIYKFLKFNFREYTFQEYLPQFRKLSCDITSGFCSWNLEMYDLIYFISTKLSFLALFEMFFEIYFQVSV